MTHPILILALALMPSLLFAALLELAACRREAASGSPYKGTFR